MATQITAAIVPGDHFIAVDAASSTPMPFLFEIGTEKLRCVSGGATLVWECDRHVYGTIAQAHAATAAITEIVPVTTAASSTPGATGSSPTDVATTATPDVKFDGLWTASTATSGDSRNLYRRHYFRGAGGSGEAIRGYGTVDGVQAAVGGTVNGAHLSLLIGTGGSVSGAGNAVRATLETDASVHPGGTLAVLRLDTNLGTSSVLPATAAFLAVDNLTAVKLDLFAMFTNPSTTMIASAGTGAQSAGVSTGGVASKAVKVTVDGVAYWLPLFSSNS